MFEKIAAETPPAAAAKQVVTKVKEVNSGLQRAQTLR